MKVLNGDNWKALLLLSIVVPVGLLATFKLTGFLGEPATIAETITLEPVTWQFERPDGYSPIFHVVEAFYNDDGLMANPKINVVDYTDRPYDSYFCDELYMVTSINSSTIAHNAFIESIRVIFTEDSNQSSIAVKRSEFKLENLSLHDIKYGTIDSTKANIGLTGINHPNSIYYEAGIIWILQSQNTQTHQMEVSYELTYYNGTAYNKIIQPFKIQIRGGIEG